MSSKEPVILEKITRKHTFILGKSTVLESSSVVELDGGSVGLHYVRRDGRTGIHLIRFQTFGALVESKRAFESEYITGEVSA